MWRGAEPGRPPEPAVTITTPDALRSKRVALRILSSIALALAGRQGHGLSEILPSGRLGGLPVALHAQIVAPVIVMAGFMLARLLAGKLDAVRRAVFDNLALLWAYAIGQGAFALALTHGFPRLVG